MLKPNKMQVFLENFN